MPLHNCAVHARDLPSFPTRRSSDLDTLEAALGYHLANKLDSPAMPAMLVREVIEQALADDPSIGRAVRADLRSEEHTSELQSRGHLVCRLLLEKKKQSAEMSALIIS